MNLSKATAKLATYKKLANKLAPVTLSMVADVALADKRARNPRKGKPLKKNIPEVTTFLKKAQEAGVLKEVEAPLLKGRDLLDLIKPGPELGVWVMKAYELQLKKGSGKQGLTKSFDKKAHKRLVILCQAVLRNPGFLFASSFLYAARISGDS